VASGRQPFIEFLTKFVKPQPIKDRVTAPLVAILAEGDLVLMVFARELKDPKDESKTYTSTWFDMWRIEDGKMAEHWDAATRQ
jgi:predicted SnoaL-like aldol condensation-catalyzing enzyme